MSADTSRLLADFRSAFGRPAAVLSVAPGRVNLIGEHTDYNEGFVLPVAIDRTVAVAVARRDDGAFIVRSIDYSECDSFRSDPERAAAGWRNYVRGVVWASAALGHIAGTDLAVSGDVPQGAGLSSSAAIEVTVAGALAAIGGHALPAPEIARLARRAENEFVGVPCGIMDQFASALCRAGHALLIDCRTETVEHIPLPFADAGVSIVVVDSKVPRRLTDTPYTRRREECAEAARALGLESLRDADEAALGLLPGPQRRRARHVIRESKRVLAAVAALRAGRLDNLGKLMYESHASLRDDFEVSCAELDLLVELASGTDGIVGARLTGAGFGGCTVNLVRGEAIDRFRTQVVDKYRNETGLPAEMHICRAVDGLKVMDV
ncbi:MAG TPA: galactokinase [Dehalococcoidia bacterium]|nr:galactokinase [Dehalococcoidia bacterium]